jgi:hypothetical protein
VSPATRGLETHVTLEIAAARGGADLTLTHSGLPDDDMARGHEEGWKGLLEVLAKKIGGLRR